MIRKKIHTINTNSRLESIINNIVLRLKNSENSWERLSKYIKNIEVANKTMLQDFFETSDIYSDLEITNSFVTSYKSGYIFLFYCKDSIFSSEYLHLGVQSHSDSKISLLNNADDFQGELFRLKDLIEEKYEAVDDFLNSIISDDDFSF